MLKKILSVVMVLTMLLAMCALSGCEQTGYESSGTQNADDSSSSSSHKTKYGPNEKFEIYSPTHGSYYMTLDSKWQRLTDFDVNGYRGYGLKFVMDGTDYPMTFSGGMDLSDMSNAKSSIQVQLVGRSGIYADGAPLTIDIKQDEAIKKLNVVFAYGIPSDDSLPTKARVYFLGEEDDYIELDLSSVS